MQNLPDETPAPDNSTGGMVLSCCCVNELPVRAKHV
jgi:hypothetical protein